VLHGRPQPGPRTVFQPGPAQSSWLVVARSGWRASAADACTPASSRSPSAARQRAQGCSVAGDWRLDVLSQGQCGTDKLTAENGETVEEVDRKTEHRRAASRDREARTLAP
jgi:hypothetical protein